MRVRVRMGTYVQLRMRTCVSSRVLQDAMGMGMGIHNLTLHDSYLDGSLELLSCTEAAHASQSSKFVSSYSVSPSELRGRDQLNRARTEGKCTADERRGHDVRVEWLCVRVWICA